MASPRSRSRSRRRPGGPPAAEEPRFRRDPVADPVIDPTAEPAAAPPAEGVDPELRSTTARHRPVADPTTDPELASTPAAGRPAVAPESTWRDDVVTASGLNVLAGIWLIIAPFVLNYANGDPYWNDIVFGAIVAVLAIIRVGGAYRAPELSWINALIGIWLIVSAFWLDHTSRAAWNDVIIGAVVLVLAALSAGASEEANAVAPRPRWRR